MREAKAHIANNEILEAINVIKSDFPMNRGQEEDLIFIESAFIELSRKEKRGTLNQDQIEIRQARVKQALLDLLNNKFDKKQSNLAKKINKRKIDRNQNIIITILSILVISSIALLSFDYFSKPNQSTKDYNTIVENLVAIDFIGDVYIDYKDAYINDLDHKLPEIRSKAKGIRKRLDLISNDKLELHGIIYKYIGLTLCNKVLALTTKSDKEAIRFSTLMLENVEHGQKAISKINSVEDEGYKEALHEWVLTEEHNIRFKVNKLIGFAANFKAGGQIEESQMVTLLKELDADYILEKQNYEIYPIIIWLRNYLKN